jgi:cytochrome c5
MRLAPWLAAALAALALATAEAAASTAPPAPPPAAQGPPATFPGGPEAEAVNRDCLACHSADMALDQPPLPADAWRAEVDKMVRVYHARVPRDDTAAIVAYLAARRPQ